MYFNTVALSHSPKSGSTEAKARVIYDASGSKMGMPGRTQADASHLWSVAIRRENIVGPEPSTAQLLSISLFVARAIGDDVPTSPLIVLLATQIAAR